MKCYICDTEDWHKITIPGDGGTRIPIHSKGCLQICKQCGNSCFDVDSTQEEKVKEYYRKDYRPAPNISNLITTTHKVNYVRVFLTDLLK